jgi:Flp pilus assembly pilin Flp
MSRAKSENHLGDRLATVEYTEAVCGCSKECSVLANPRETTMSNFKNVVRRFFNDESGAEVTELGVVLALIVAGAVASIALIGPKIVAAYAAVQAALGA